MSEPTTRRGGRRRAASVPLTGITPVSSTRLADDVAAQIRALIIKDDVAEGARLPSERDLADRFGTSRPTVSQALRSLSLMGLVEIRRGSGAYVLRRPESMVTASVNLMLDLDGRSVGDLMQLRLWLETLGVEEAAGRPEPDETERAEILGALDRVAETAGSMSEWVAADTVFHAAVVRACGNPYLAAMYESVHTTVLTYEFRQWVDSDSAPAWLREATPAQQRALHQPIADAVLARDRRAARAAVAAHHRRMLDHLEETVSRTS